MNPRALCAKTKHRVPLLPVTLNRLRHGCFAQETLNRVAAACTGPFLKLHALFAAGYLGRQQ